MLLDEIKVYKMLEIEDKFRESFNMISLKSNVPRFLTSFSQELDQEVSKKCREVLTNLEVLNSLRKS